MTVIDIDRHFPKDATLPLTATVKTGREQGPGLHLLYSGAEMTAVHDFGEVKGERAYSVLPPSRHHATGRPYQWQLHPDELEEAYGYRFASVESVRLPAGGSGDLEPCPDTPGLADPTGHLWRRRVICTAWKYCLGTAWSRLEQAWRTEGLTAFDRDEEAARAQAKMLGISTQLGRGFSCVLHPDKHPSATLHRSENGTLLYHDWHSRSKRDEWLPLAAVYAMLHGSARPIGRLLAVWHLRLLVNAGILVEPEHVLAELEPDAPEEARLVWEGMRRLAHTGEPPFVYSERFAASWLGIRRPEVRVGVSWLEDNGYLKFSGFLAGQYPRPTPLWTPTPYIASMNLRRAA
jgi:hypothetical protein